MWLKQELLSGRGPRNRGKDFGFSEELEKPLEGFEQRNDIVPFHFKEITLLLEGTLQ